MATYLTKPDKTEQVLTELYEIRKMIEELLAKQGEHDGKVRERDSG